MEQDYEIKPSCKECDAIAKDDHRYCHNCGAYLGHEAVSISIYNNADLRRVFFFYFIYLFFCLYVKHSSWINTYDEMVWVELVLAGITTWFAWQNRAKLKPVLRFNNFKWYILAGVVLIAALASTIVSLSVRELNVTFFHTDVSYYTAYKIYIFPVLIMIYSIAIMPAIFEELAFRGVMYNYCSNFLDERLVVVITAFLFAIMHLSLISLAWLLPFGIFIGSLRRRYNTLWYGIFFHFTFNLTACLIDLYRQGELF